MKTRKIFFKIGVILFLIIFLLMVFLPFISQNASAPIDPVPTLAPNALNAEPSSNVAPNAASAPDNTPSVISTEAEKSE